MTFIGAALFQWVNVKGWVMVIGTITAYAAIASFPWNIVIQVLLTLLMGILSFPYRDLDAVRHLAADAGKIAARQAVRAFNIAMAVLLLASLYPVFSVA